MVTLVFFGSFQNYSVQVLEKLLRPKNLLKIVAVVTTPPQPFGRKLAFKLTATQVFAEKHGLPVFPLVSLEGEPRKILGLKSRPDFIITAGYGKLIPPPWLELSNILPVNLHHSLLPQYPGRFPAEWAILMGEVQTGVSLVKMSPEFDNGEILAQEQLPILPQDTRQTLYQQLYEIGANLIVKNLPRWAAGRIRLKPQDFSQPRKYARQITREDGFVDWRILKLARDGLKIVPTERVNFPVVFKEIADFKRLQSLPSGVLVERMVRAFDPWPGVWSKIESRQEERRVKILKAHLEEDKLIIDQVQLAGKQPITWPQFARGYKRASDF